MAVLAVSVAPLPDPSGAFTDRAQGEYLASLVQRVSHELGARPRNDTANTSFMMMSPNGSVFAISVNDAGALTTSAVHGPGLRSGL